MKILKILSIICFSVMLCACLPGEKYLHENQNNPITEISFSELPSDKCFLIVGEKNESTESLVEYMKRGITLETGNSIYLLYTDSNEEIINFFGIKDKPTLYLLENKEITDKVEFYNKDDMKDLPADKYVIQQDDIKTNIFDFMKENQ